MTDKYATQAVQLVLYLWRDGRVFRHVPDAEGGTMPSEAESAQKVALSVLTPLPDGQASVAYFITFNLMEGHPHPFHTEISSAGVLIVSADTSTGDSEMVVMYSPGSWSRVTSGNVTPWTGGTKPADLA